MSDPNFKEVAPGLYNEDGEFTVNLNKAVPEGARRGIVLIEGTAINRKQRFDETLIKELHASVMYYLPGVAGKYRLGEDVRIGDYRVASWQEIPNKMYLFGRWLDEQTENLKDRTEDLLGALRLACEAHYGLTSPVLHPFDDGNGRVARLLANGILMMNAHELMFYGIKILPVPLLRQVIKSRDDPYIKILDGINHTRIINPFEVYVARVWVHNLTQMINRYSLIRKGSGKITEADEKLLEKFRNRIRVLNGFIAENENRTKFNELHAVPDYFQLRYIKK